MKRRHFIPAVAMGVVSALWPWKVRAREAEGGTCSTVKDTCGDSIVTDYNGNRFRRKNWSRTWWAVYEKQGDAVELVGYELQEKATFFPLDGPATPDNVPLLGNHHAYPPNGGSKEHPTHGGRGVKS